MRVVDDLHVRAFTPLAAPRELKSRFPLSETGNRTVYEAREAIKRILRRDDNRLLVVVGPCSIHDPAAAFEYAGLLREAQLQFGDRLLLVMRVYLEKPRTTVGWRGLINDPYLDDSFDMGAGLAIARDILARINDMGVPTATEMVDPISPQFISDLVSIAAIGARTTESQTHRAMASGLSMPVGYKNSTDGSIQVAVQSYIAATHSHSFLGIDPEGRGAVVKTVGNPDGFVILRGSRQRTNYDADSISHALDLMRQAELTPAVMVDCSHANSRSDHTRQPLVWNEVLEHHVRRHDGVIGMMVESNLYEGKQSIPDHHGELRYGVSITDACVSWETTVKMFQAAYKALG